MKQVMDFYDWVDQLDNDYIYVNICYDCYDRKGNCRFCDRAFDRAIDRYNYDYLKQFDEETRNKYRILYYPKQFGKELEQKI